MPAAQDTQEPEDRYFPPGQEVTAAPQLMNAWMVSQLLSPAKVVGQLAYPKKNTVPAPVKGATAK